MSNTKNPGLAGVCLVDAVGIEPTMPKPQGYSLLSTPPAQRIQWIVYIYSKSDLAYTYSKYYLAYMYSKVKSFFL